MNEKELIKDIRKKAERAVVSAVDSAVGESDMSDDDYYNLIDRVKAAVLARS